MNLEKQEAFLNHIANRLGRPRKSGVKPPEWQSQPYAHLYEGKSHEDLVQQFIDNLSVLHTQVDRISRNELGPALQRVIQRFGVKSAILWDEDKLHDLALIKELTLKGVDAVCWEQSMRLEDLRSSAAHVDLGIAWADQGLAETGTVVLFNGGGRGRMVSLLPPAFLCILSEETIVPRLTQAVRQIHQKVPQGLPALINFITGPSRTGDIEMDLAFGVHGPGKVHVILLKD